MSDYQLMPVGDAVRFLRKAEPICDRTVRRLIDAKKLRVHGLRKNPRGKPTQIICLNELARLVCAAKRPVWVRFQFQCERVGVPADLTLHLLASGCAPDLDHLAAAMQLVIAGEVVFLRGLHGAPIPSKYRFQASMVASILSRADPFEASGLPFRAQWEQARKEAQDWVVRSWLPQLFTRVPAGSESTPEHEIRLVPLYLRPFKGNEHYRGIVAPPDWMRVSIEPIPKYLKRIGSKVIGAIQEHSFDLVEGAKKEGFYVQSADRALAFAAAWKPERGVSPKGAAKIGLRPAVEDLMALGVDYRSAFSFLLAWWLRHNRQRRRISERTVNRVFGLRE